MSRKITLNEVALKAEVSPTTAARVLHGRGYVSETNRNRVETAIRDLGYRPNIQARGLRNSRSYVIGLILSSATANPFFTNIAHAVRTAANANGLSVQNFNHTYDLQVERDGIARFLDHRVEAVIACHALDPRNLQPLIAAGTPIIEIERKLSPKAHHILLDPAPGMIEAVRSLALAGHKRIAYLGGIARVLEVGERAARTVERQRIEAFRSAIKACGLSLQSTHVDEVAYDDVDITLPLQGLAWGKATLAEPKRPTAIIAGSDVLAAGILQAAQTLALRVPKDLVVIGYDDSIARFLAPPLPTIAPPYTAIGIAAIEMIQKARSSSARLSQTLPTTFISRDFVTIT